jgi:hypothetical protein
VQRAAGGMYESGSSVAGESSEARRVQQSERMGGRCVGREGGGNRAIDEEKGGTDLGDLA